jgi:GMP reductase
MRIENSVELDFDDVLILPKRSNIQSRKHIQLTRTYVMPYTGQQFSCLPIFAANMSSVGTLKMARELAKQLACCCLHKFYKPIALIDFFKLDFDYSFYTLGIRDKDLEKLQYVASKIPIKRICIDAANGYTQFFVNRVRLIRKLFPGCILIAGNVCTSEMVQELILVGADIVKVGIGPGSFCTTRLMTGVGRSQLSAIIECADAAHGLNGFVMADGGCKTPGDIIKAFGAGADFVMLGGMLAGTDECDGLHTNEGLQVYGMSSREAQEKYYGSVRDYCVPEGKCSIVPFKGPVANVIKEITGGLRSACAYVGAKSLKDFSKCTTFVRIR